MTSWQIYVVTPTVDLDYFLALDSKAELLSDSWKDNEDCDNSIQEGSAFCKNFACALTLPRCNAQDDRPLPVCRDTCKDCFRTCAPDRPILPPSIFYSDDQEGLTWGVCAPLSAAPHRVSIPAVPATRPSEPALPKGSSSACAPHPPPPPFPY